MQRMQSVIQTNEAECADCYRCVRVCPVKAIRVRAGQASVDPKRCIACGTCVRECPQGAKTFRNDVGRVEALLKERKTVAASLAPTFAGVFEPWALLRLPAALRRLGFSYVAETAVGAAFVAAETNRLLESGGRGWVTTACPAAVSYIERYRPQLVSSLLPVTSPMVAHARHVKASLGAEAGFVFIGPCVAKKAEAERPEHAGLIDAVLTFEELDQWLAERGIDLAHCEESAFDEEPGRLARLFPVVGGALAAGGWPAGAMDRESLMLSGHREVEAALGSCPTPGAPRVMETLFCPLGCVNGPGIGREGNPFERRSRVLAWAGQRPGGKEAATSAPLGAIFQADPADAGPEPSEEQVRALLERTGKARKELQLNCGACGYASCLDQARAVLKGMAEPEMCIPYMRRLAEQRSDRIIETSPNGILVVDRDLVVQGANSAFLRLFKVPSAVGQRVSELMDPDPFEQVLSGQVESFDGERHHEGAGLDTRQLIYALPNEGRLVGIFVALPRAGEEAERLRRLKDETVQQARELFEHQVAMARELATTLGEHTAKGELMVRRLVEAAQKEGLAGGD